MRKAVLVKEVNKTIDILGWENSASNKLTSYLPISMRNKPRRPFGLCAGEFSVPDDFDAPLPEDILSAFEGG
ncbi:prevent-host-death protein [Tolypothrix sp. FACHB-123]|uniref:prevent-host-death protein n=1 Tax=Tolypothrix sp. FACHB-123 TaxID=2692868 RepID=UPI001687A23A|nr:prevent-host-death protein [Tolypothrix sp. FACHB-123]MBD2356654.1 prevent-host-death protein [Tolypothrix sp. FACHB-123]